MFVRWMVIVTWSSKSVDTFSCWRVDMISLVVLVSASTDPSSIFTAIARDNSRSSSLKSSSALAILTYSVYVSLRKLDGAEVDEDSMFDLGEKNSMCTKTKNHSLRNRLFSHFQAVLASVLIVFYSIKLNLKKSVKLFLISDTVDKVKKILKSLKNCCQYSFG